MRIKCCLFTFGLIPRGKQFNSLFAKCERHIAHSTTMLYVLYMIQYCMCIRFAVFISCSFTIDVKVEYGFETFDNLVVISLRILNFVWLNLFNFGLNSHKINVN